MGCVKVNVGAAMKDSTMWGIGVVIRNDLGVVIAAMAKRLRTKLSIHVAECLAARKATILIGQFGFSNRVRCSECGMNNSKKFRPRLISSGIMTLCQLDPKL
ncbi:hypothetical protein L484_002621 [Morus notabilis]|uniref:RNase H type-1 domain-containing protein n=1 Tax=Morus notabilis TaxID=981085 RepID=W9R0T4_9ROSA|nr:hypothetical protein L484_002621 [Morus notabilis]